MQQRSSIKMNQGRSNLSDFYELKDTPPPQPARQFKIPSSSDIIGSQEPQSSGPSPATVMRPNPPPSPSVPSYSFQKFRNDPPPSDESNLLANPRNIHCVVIADHIMDCPICSRFYRNYTPIYNVIILILGIAIVVLIIRCNNKNMSGYIRPAMPPPTI